MNEMSAMDKEKNQKEERSVSLIKHVNDHPASLVKTVFVPKLELPEFNPDDPKSMEGLIWITNADLCITEQYKQGATLMTTLNHALTGTASTWLASVMTPGMTWDEFKKIFLARYAAESPAAYLIRLSESRPRPYQYLDTYADVAISGLLLRWEHLSIEQIAVATVLAHMSTFDERVRKLAMGKTIPTRYQLFVRLKSLNFMKRRAPSEEIVDIPEITRQESSRPDKNNVSKERKTRRSGNSSDSDSTGTTSTAAFHSSAKPRDE